MKSHTHTILIGLGFLSLATACLMLDLSDLIVYSLATVGGVLIGTGIAANSG